MRRRRSVSRPLVAQRPSQSALEPEFDRSPTRTSRAGRIPSSRKRHRDGCRCRFLDEETFSVRDPDNSRGEATLAATQRGGTCERTAPTGQGRSHGRDAAAVLPTGLTGRQSRRGLNSARFRLCPRSSHSPRRSARHAWTANSPPSGASSRAARSTPGGLRRPPGSHRCPGRVHRERAGPRVPTDGPDSTAWFSGRHHTASPSDDDPDRTLAPTQRGGTCERTAPAGQGRSHGRGVAVVLPARPRSPRRGSAGSWNRSGGTEQPTLDCASALIARRTSRPCRPELLRARRALRREASDEHLGQAQSG